MQRGYAVCVILSVAAVEKWMHSQENSDDNFDLKGVVALKPSMVDTRFL